MGWLSRMLFGDNTDEAERVGRQMAQEIKAEHPNLADRSLAKVQVALEKAYEQQGHSGVEGDAFNAAFCFEYTGKVYCEECKGYYLPHEH